MASVHAVVYGRVQGVYFRAFVAEKATELELKGYVRNLPGGRTVEVRAEGERDKLKSLIEYLEVGPSGAKVEKVVTDWLEYGGKYSHFNIRY